MRTFGADFGRRRSRSAAAIRQYPATGKRARAVTTSAIPLAFYRVCCTSRRSTQRTRLARAREPYSRAQLFINKTEPSFLSCLPSQKARTGQGEEEMPRSSLSRRTFSVLYNFASYACLKMAPYHPRVNADEKFMEFAFQIFLPRYSRIVVPITNHDWRSVAYYAYTSCARNPF